MWATILSAILIGGKCIKEACQRELPAEYHGNVKLEAHDLDEVRMGRMTQREFERNMDRGKYYAPPKPANELDPVQLRHYLYGRWHGTLNEKCDWGKYEFIKNMTKEEAHEKYISILKLY